MLVLLGFIFAFPGVIGSTPAAHSAPPVASSPAPHVPTAAEKSSPARTKTPRRSTTTAALKAWAAHKPTTAAHRPSRAAHQPTTVRHKPTKAAHTPSRAAHRPLPAAHRPSTAASKPTAVSPQSSRDRAIYAAAARYGFTVRLGNVPGYTGRAYATTDMRTCVVYASSFLTPNVVLDVLRHEFVHVLLCRAGTSFATKHGEHVADAGAALLGSNRTPFYGPFTTDDTLEARRLLALMP